MGRARRIALALCSLLLEPCYIRAQSGGSFFTRTTAGLTISGAGPVIALSGVIPNSGTPRDILLAADGSVTPMGTGGAAELVIETSLDGTTWAEASNRSRVGWSDAGQVTAQAASHSFNCVGIVTQDGSDDGQVFVRLAAYQRTAGYTYSVNGFTSLTAMVRKQGCSRVAYLPADTGNLASNISVSQWTWPSSGGGTLSPQSNRVLQLALPSTGEAADLIMFASGSVSRLTTSGDCMLGMWLAGEALRTNEGNWSINDLWPYADITAPVFNHGLVTNLPLNGQLLEWRASRLWWGPGANNNVSYKALSGAALVAIWGSSLVGKSMRPTSPTGNWTATATQEAFLSSQGQAGFVPPGVPDLVSRFPLGSTIVTIPPGHSGIVCFTARCRFQPHQNTSPITPDFGDVYLYMTLDPVGTAMGSTQVGSVGYQQTCTNGGLGSESQRTLCCSYLSAGATALSAGQYQVAAYMIGSPFTTHSFYRAGYYWDTCLVFFD